MTIIGARTDNLAGWTTIRDHLPMRRVFLAEGREQIVAAATAILDDVVYGTIPWVSWKYTESAWSDILPADLHLLLDVLGTIDGEIWFTPHHEPENDLDRGTAADFQTMLQRVAQCAPPNVKVGPILMSYTWNPEAKRVPNEWLPPLGSWARRFDFVGLDAYPDNKGEHLSTIDAAAAIKGTGYPLAVGEVGFRRSTNTTPYSQFARFVAFNKTYEPIASCYFDLDVQHDTELTDEARAAMAAAITLQ